MDTLEKISLDALLPWNPFDNTVWLGLENPITVREVQHAINTDTLAAYPLCFVQNDNISKGRSYHIQRVGYLVKYGWSDAIVIDVGIPSLGRHVDWIVIDGNHRLAAAIFRNDNYITASISGEISYAEHLLKLNN